jgi:hypothetical protein
MEPPTAAEAAAAASAEPPAELRRRAANPTPAAVVARRERGQEGEEAEEEEAEAEEEEAISLSSKGRSFPAEFSEKVYRTVATVVQYVASLSVESLHLYILYSTLRYELWKLERGFVAV